MGKTFFDGHLLKKGKFIAPMNQLENLSPSPWVKQRMPEYLWLSLIIIKSGHTKGLELCCMLIDKLHELNKEVFTPKWSSITTMDEAKQYIFYKVIFDLKLDRVLAPLSILFAYSNAPIFARVFSNCGFNIEEYLSQIKNAFVLTNDHQSETSTDTRFCVVFSVLKSGKVQDMTGAFQRLDSYPTLEHSDEKLMPMLRSSIRAFEIGIVNIDETNSDEYLTHFWNRVEKIMECNLFYVDMKEEPVEAQDFLNEVKSILSYHSDLMLAAKPTDSKYTVLLSLATYAYKRLVEVVEHNLFHAISGRGCVRVIVECCIMMKYLLDEEKNHSNIWDEYQVYGLGKYKLIVERIKANNVTMSDSHLVIEYLDFIASEFIRKEFIDMDTSYFDNKGVRDKAIQVGEKDLFDYFYDYDSQYEHALWGAIRESSLLKCNEASHGYHCVPDVENNIKLKNVWHDCCFVFKKVIEILNSEYGCPEHLVIEVK